jgi:serine/threonine-protein kinase
MTRCPVCSSENAETQRFCGECGTPLPASAHSAPPAALADETILLPTAELEPGTVFARRYQVIESLGAGGMGQVYRVQDRKVGEEVALKFIRAEVASDRGILDRFAQELGKGRQVVHRNVARMFDLGEEGRVPYFTMEYVRGESLKRLIRKVGRLDPAQAIPFACQICAGLDAIHGRNIVHRDLKPQNIIIDEDGQAKILDFGLAQTLGAGRAGAGSSRSGTPAYAAPEQIAGRTVDHRADIYALGVVLYEMLTGRPPFQAASLDELIDRQAHDRPRDPRAHNPGLSAELSRVVLKCLEKDPDARFQNAAELGAALNCLKGLSRPRTLWGKIVRWARDHKLVSVAAGAVGLSAIALLVVYLFFRPDPWKPSVAVLPVEDTGIIEGANSSFLAGLQTEISDRLRDIPELRVISDKTVNSIDQTRSAKEIGKALRAGYLVNVSVAFHEGKVDGKVRLIRARSGEEWPTKSFTKPLSDYGALQDEIAVMIAQALGVELAPEKLKKFSLRGTKDLEAYVCFLKGMELLEAAENEEQVRSALGSLSQAVAIDPDYALGHWGLGYACERLYHSRREDKDPAILEEMYRHFQEAERIDPSFAETNLGVGWYYFNKGDNELAFDHFGKALGLDRDGYMANRDTGAFLRSIGFYKQALRYLDRSRRLSPSDTEPLIQIAQCWICLGQFEKALKFTRHALAIRESDPNALFMHISLLSLTGRDDEAESRIRALERFDLSNKRIPFLRKMARALREGRGRPYAFVDGSPGLSPQGTYLYLAFGMKEEALANIGKGIAKGFRLDGTYYYSYPSLVKNPMYKALRGDPRFEEILKRQKELYEKELRLLERL